VQPKLPFGRHIGVVDVVLVDVEVVGVVVEVVLTVQAGAQPTNPGWTPATQTNPFLVHSAQSAASLIRQGRPEGQPIQVVVPSAAKSQLQFAGQGGSHIGGAAAHTSPPSRPSTHTRLQHSSSAVQDSPFGRHIGVVEVVLVDVEVVGVVVEVEVVDVSVVEVVLVVLVVVGAAVVVVVGLSHGPRVSPWAWWP